MKDRDQGSVVRDQNVEELGNERTREQTQVPGSTRADRAEVVVLMSAQGQAVPDIAHLLDCSQE